MKVKIIAVIIFTLVIAGVCVFELLITGGTIERVKQANYEIIELSKNNTTTNNELYDKLDKIGRFWADRENYLCLIFNHKDMVELGKEIEQAKSYLILDNKREAIVHLELLTEDILSLEHIVLFNLQNLF